MAEPEPGTLAAALLERYRAGGGVPAPGSTITLLGPADLLSWAGFSHLGG